MDFTEILHTFIHIDKETIADMKHQSDSYVCIIKSSYVDRVWFL